MLNAPVDYWMFYIENRLTGSAFFLRHFSLTTDGFFVSQGWKRRPWLWPSSPPPGLMILKT